METSEFEIFELNDTRYRTTINKKFAQRKSWIPHDPNKIISVIPGTIEEIFVHENQKIKKGECMLILEAMKMKNRINAPKDCTIEKIHISTGDKLPKGALLLEIL